MYLCHPHLHHHQTEVAQLLSACQLHCNVEEQRPWLEIPPPTTNYSDFFLVSATYMYGGKMSSVAMAKVVVVLTSSDDSVFQPLIFRYKEMRSMSLK